MVTLPRLSILRSTLILAAASVAACALACGGGSPGPGRPAPAPAAPTDVIVFGAQAEDDSFGLYLVQPDGAGLRKLTDEAGSVSGPRWSPDGDRVAYAVAGATSSLRVYDFATASAKTLDDHLLAGDLGPALSWSPDGGRLAFIEDVAGGRLRIYDLLAGRLLDMADVPAVAVDWSPSGDTLAIVRPGDSAQQSTIHSVKADGSAAKVIAGGGELNGDPRWSSDGKRLAAWSAPSAQITARSLAVRKANGDVLLDPGPGLDPAWSRGGQLAFSRPSATQPGATLDLYLLAEHGGQPELVSQASALARWPSWSASSDALAYLARVDLDTALLCTVTLATRKQSCLDVGGLLPSQPAWSPF